MSLTIAERLIIIETEIKSREVEPIELLELIGEKLSEKNDLGEYVDHLIRIICSFKPGEAFEKIAHHITYEMEEY